MLIIFYLRANYNKHYVPFSEFVHNYMYVTLNNEPLGSKGPPLVREEVHKEDVGEVESW
jgi:hypothetical protein